MISARPRLSAEQQAVVDHQLPAPAVIVAGAGTGKTFTIVERVAALHESGECPADRVLLLTFARKAAAELRRRVSERLGERVGLCATFHAFAWKILTSAAYDVGLPPETQVIEDAEARVEFRAVFDDFLRRPNAAVSGFPLRPYNQGEIRDALFGIAQDLKQRAIAVHEFRTRALAATEAFAAIGFRTILRPLKRGGPKPVAETTDLDLKREVEEERARIETAAGILEAFDERLRARNALTYPDLLVHAERAIRASDSLRQALLARYRCCIVDEYQDTDLAQHRLLEALYGPELANVMAVGDVLQSIYAFRGAHPENIEILKSAPGAQTYTLVNNRRSRQEILELAHATVVASHADALPLQAERGTAGEQVVEVDSLWRAPDEDHVPADEARVREAAAVARRISHCLLAGGEVVRRDGTSGTLRPADIAILSRTKLNVQAVTDALLAVGVPFRLVGGVGFYDAAEIRDALAWIRLLADPFDAFAIARALQSPVIGLSDVALSQLVTRVPKRDLQSLPHRVLLQALEPDALSDPEMRARLARFHDLIDQLAPFAGLPLISAVQAVFELTGLEEYWRRSTEPRAPQARANLEKLESLTRSFAQSTPGAQPAEFVAFIGELEKVDYDEREADVPADNAVTISTIHAAKGLEWPLVFVLGVWPDPRPAARLRLDHQSGALLYAESADGSRPFHYSIFEHHADAAGMARADEDEEAKAAHDAEEARLFYVALTRARDRVYVSGLRRRPSKPHPQGKPHDFLERVYEWVRSRAWQPDRPPARAPAGALPPIEASVALRHRPAVRPPGAVAETRVPPLSYSVIASFERCPRQAIYRTMYRLPSIAAPGIAALGPDGDWSSPAIADDSLLRAGDYGLLVHKALELWAKQRVDGAAALASAAYVEAAGRFLDLHPATAQKHKAESVVARAIQHLGAWTPLAIEAPFLLDFGPPEQPLLVSGFIDLVARDDAGRVCVLDYKTGDTPQESHALQIALYQRAVAAVYGHAGALGFIGRVAGDDFSLEAIEPVSPATLEQRVLAARDGLRMRTDRAVPGQWCFQCAYRNAPCLDFVRQR